MYLRTCNICGAEAWGNSRARAMELLKQHKKEAHG
jgi:hypothetical protein